MNLHRTKMWFGFVVISTTIASLPTAFYICKVQAEESQRVACYVNLHIIASLMKSHAMARRLIDNAPVTPHVISSYAQGKLPTCPSGGKYIITRIGFNPVCTIHGDLLHDKNTRADYIKEISRYNKDGSSSGDEEDNADWMSDPFLNGSNRFGTSTSRQTANEMTSGSTNSHASATPK